MSVCKLGTDILSLGYNIFHSCVLLVSKSLGLLVSKTQDHIENR